MIKPYKGKLLIKYNPPDTWASKEHGIYLPSAKEMRDMMRKKDRYKLDIDTPPPDIFRWGEYIDGETKEDIPKGSFVYYNKHDGDNVKHEGEEYVLLPRELAFAYYVPENID